MKTDRRGFLTRAALIAAALPVASQTIINEALASGNSGKLPKLDPKKNAQAKSLAYYHNAADFIKNSKVDGQTVNADKTKAKKGNNCSNCTLYCLNKAQAFKDGGKEWGPCALFPGKVVAAEGMCNTWAKKAAAGKCTG